MKPKNPPIDDLYAHLTPVLRGDEIVDVRLAYDEDLTAQQLRFRRLENSRSIVEG